MAKTYVKEWKILEEDQWEYISEEGKDVLEEEDSESLGF